MNAPAAPCSAYGAIRPAASDRQAALARRLRERWPVRQQLVATAASVGVPARAAARAANGAPVAIDVWLRLCALATCHPVAPSQPLIAPGTEGFDPVLFAVAVGTARQARRWTVRTAARQARLSPASWCRAETACQSVSSETVCAICQELRLDPRDFARSARAAAAPA